MYLESTFGRSAERVRDSRALSWVPETGKVAKLCHSYNDATEKQDFLFDLFLENTPSPFFFAFNSANQISKNHAFSTDTRAQWLIGPQFDSPRFQMSLEMVFLAVCLLFLGRVLHNFQSWAQESRVLPRVKSNRESRVKNSRDTSLIYIYILLPPPRSACRLKVHFKRTAFVFLTFLETSVPLSKMHFKRTASRGGGEYTVVYSPPWEISSTRFPRCPVVIVEIPVHHRRKGAFYVTCQLPFLSSGVLDVRK